jgi:hypothetical protein
MKMKPLKIKGIKLKKGEELLHYHPICYCIAKHSETSALFAIPPQSKGIVTDSGYVSVHFDKSELCKQLRIGDWCEVGYISTSISGENRVLKILKAETLKDLKIKQMQKKIIKIIKN